MEDSLALTPEVLRGMACEAYHAYATDNPEHTTPVGYLNNMFAPYAVRREEVAMACGSLSGCEKLPWSVHPAELTVKTMATLATGPNLNSRLVYAMTALPHVWGKRSGDSLCLSLKNRRRVFCAYDSPGHPVPYVWLHIDPCFMNLVTVSRVHGAPFLHVDYRRYDHEGRAFMPILVEDNADPLDSPAKLQMSVYEEARTLGPLRCGVDSVSPTNHPNFMIFVSHGAHVRYVDCFLVCPSRGQVWRYPVIMHEL